MEDRPVSGRALSFGAVAERYERFRPGYPSELFDHVAAYAARPIRTALEIGAGTGKATRLLAAHGVTVTATEPDADMLAELRKHVPASVTTVQSAFEDVPMTSTFDVVYAAASLHWTRAECRWERIAALLEVGGVFACFGGPIQLADGEIAEAVRAARAPYLASDDVVIADAVLVDRTMEWPGLELQQSELFDDVRESVIERRLSMSTEDYVGHLSTVSAYLELSPSDQEQTYDAIRRVLPATVEINADITAHLARRNERQPVAGATS